MASQSRALRTIPGEARRGGSRPRRPSSDRARTISSNAERVEHREHVTGDVRERARGEIGGAFARAVTADVDAERVEFVAKALRDRVEEARAEPIGVLQQQRRPVAAPVERIDAQPVVLDGDRPGIGHGGARYPTAILIASVGEVVMRTVTQRRLRSCSSCGLVALGASPAFAGDASRPTATTRS